MPNSENKRSGARFNLFDVLLIFVVVICITGLVLHAYFTRDLTETYSQTAKVSFTVSGVSKETAEAFCRIGATIFSSETDEKLGTVITAAHAPLYLDLETADGHIVKAEHPEKKEIMATAELVGTWNTDGFLIGGTTLAAVGKTINIYTENAICTVTITNVSQ